MKVAILWLVNERGEVLMARRADHMSTDAGVWGPSVSGKVDQGETAEEAVIREASEELGIKDGEIKPIFLHDEIFSDHSDGRARGFSLYYARIPSIMADDFTLEPNEVSEIKWFEQSELEQLAAVKSPELIISSATELWLKIFAHLRPYTSEKSPL